MLSAVEALWRHVGPLRKDEEYLLLHNHVEALRARRKFVMRRWKEGPIHGEPIPDEVRRQRFLVLVNELDVNIQTSLHKMNGLVGALKAQATDSLLAHISYAIPRRYREGLLGDVLEDVADQRDDEWPEWKIRIYAVLGLLSNLIARTRNLIRLSALISLITWIVEHIRQRFKW